MVDDDDDDEDDEDDEDVWWLLLLLLEGASRSMLLSLALSICLGRLADSVASIVEGDCFLFIGDLVRPAQVHVVFSIVTTSERMADPTTRHNALQDSDQIQTHHNEWLSEEYQVMMLVSYRVTRAEHKRDDSSLSTNATMARSPHSPNLSLTNKLAHRYTLSRYQRTRSKRE